MPSSLLGVRVVRGPDWRWGDQDGGVGYAGTIIPSSPSDLKLLGPRTVTVAWDSGRKCTYQGGPEGLCDLRIINCAALGVRHRKIPCENVSCWVQEIQGFRWQCVTCGINLCTNCFIHKIPHNKDHNQFKRYDSEQSLTPATVSSWSEEGPQSRTELVGIYPGASVSLSPVWPYGRENEMKSGKVISAPKEEISGRIVVEWDSTKERTHHPQSTIVGNEVLQVKSPGIGGYFYAGAFPSVKVEISTDINVPSLPSPSTSFTIGDRVCIDDTMDVEELKIRQKDHGNYVDEMKNYFGVVGTVQVTHGPRVYVKYRNVEKCWSFNETVLKKLNELSTNQMIRIRKDESTQQQIRNQLPAGVFEQLKGAVGRVSHVSEENSSKVFVDFVGTGSFKVNFLVTPLPSAWMERCEPVQPDPEAEIMECAAKVASLLFKAVDEENLHLLKIYHKHSFINFDARNVHGTTALLKACEKGHKDIVKWLIVEAKVDLNLAGEGGFRPIHYAVQRCRTEILEILIQKGADLNARTDCGLTALHIAVSNQFTDCSRLLIHAGCNANIQDPDGNTPLHIALLSRSAICVAQIIPMLRIDLKLTNKMGFNVLHLAVVMDDLRAIELIMNLDRVLIPLLQRMPDNHSSVLHYACTHKNFQMAKLLVEKANSLSSSNGSLFIPNLLPRLLEMKDGSEKTAFLIACQMKDYDLIEFLVKAGTDLNVIDKDGNTAIAILLMATTTLRKDDIPSKKFSPAIFKIYQSAVRDNNMKKMENLPIMCLISYLMVKGCRLAFSGNIADILARFVATIQEGAGEETSSQCMGRSDCSQPPEFQLLCPHKPPFKACSKCIVLLNTEKCHCEMERLTSIPATHSDKRVPAEQDAPEEPVVNDHQEGPMMEDFNLKWVSGGGVNGHIEDDFGNKYKFCGTRKGDGILFRCRTLISGEKSERCPSVLLKSKIRKEDGTCFMSLVSPHTHHLKKKLNDSGEGRAGRPPPSKRSRKSNNKTDDDDD